MREQRQLEEQQRALKTQLIKKRAYLREIAADFDERRTVLGELQGHIQALRQEVEAAGREHDALDRQAAEQVCACVHVVPRRRYMKCIFEMA